MTGSNEQIMKFASSSFLVYLKKPSERSLKGIQTIPWIVCSEVSSWNAKP